MSKRQAMLRHQDLLVAAGSKIQLKNIDPGATHGFANKSDAQQKLDDDRTRLCDLQDVFYAARRYAMLIIFQGMDTAGKDGAIKHVMTGLNPEGVDVHQFKEPTPEELSHDFLWRCGRVLPEKGRVGIFNRSYYEEVLVVRVHPHFLEQEGISKKDHAGIWARRFEDINNFEQHLGRNETVVVKFFLHISREEQRRRFLKRIDMPEKNWKVSTTDLTEREHWDNYMRAYEDAINQTSTTWAPWYVIPSDHKWFARTAIGDILVSQLERLALSYPKPDKQQRAALAQAKRILTHER